MGLYEAAFQRGDSVQVASIDEREGFRRTWKYHNPCTDDQLQYAGRTAKVRDVGFYHGGDALYQLDGVPGVWHEQCLRTST